MAIYINGNSLNNISSSLNEHEANITSMKGVSVSQSTLLQGAITNTIGVKHGDSKTLDAINGVEDIESFIVS